MRVAKALETSIEVTRRRASDEQLHPQMQTLPSDFPASIIPFFTHIQQSTLYDLVV